MNQSEKLDELAPAFLEAQKKFKPVAKTKTGTVRDASGRERTYKYADFNDVMEMALPILNKQGLAFSQGMARIDGETRLATRILHTSGQWMSSDGIPLHHNIPPQEMGSQITFFRRYDGCAMLGITPEEDEDGTIANQRVKATQGKAAQASPRPQSTPQGVPQQQKPKAAAPQPKQRAWSLTAELLTCEPLNAQPMERDGKKFMAVRLHQQLGGGTMAFCFVERLFGAIRNCINQPCVFRIDLTGEYPYITDVIEIAGRKYQGGIPVPVGKVVGPCTHQADCQCSEHAPRLPSSEDLDRHVQREQEESVARAATTRSSNPEITDDDLPSEFWGTEGRPNAAV